VNLNPHTNRRFTVLVYTDDNRIESETKLLSIQLNFELYYGCRETDLIAVPCDLAVVDPDKIGTLFMEFFKEVYYLDNPKEYSILLTQNYKDIPRKLKKYFITPIDKKLDIKQLKLTILNRRNAIIKRVNNKRSYDKRIFRLFIILRKLQPENSYVTMDELCEEFNVSARTINRDIELLRHAGEDIVYDVEKKSYKLNMSFSGLTRDKYKYWKKNVIK